MTSIPKPTRASKYKTAADKSRHAKIAQMPCMACGRRPVEVAHLFTGMGRRKDHQKTIPLCYPCHRGSKISAHGSTKAFSAIHGTDAELLARVNQILFLSLCAEAETA